MKSRIALLSIFVLFTFLRFYNLSNRLVFGWDQEQFSRQVYDILVSHKFTLLGPRVNNDLGFFLGPYFVYLIVPFFQLTKLHPIALLYVVVIVNILFFFISYFVLKRIFNQKIALWFLFLWTINPLMQMYDSYPWWIMLVPIGVMTTWYILFKLYKKPNRYPLYFLLGINLGFFSNMHFQFVFIDLFASIFLLLMFTQQKSVKKTLLKIFLTISGFTLMLLPLLLFDVRHSFLNIRLFFAFFLRGQGHATQDHISWINVLGNVLQPFMYFNLNILAVLLFVIFIILCYILAKKEKGFNKPFYAATVGVLLVVPIFCTVYGQRPSEYYFNFIMPFLLLILVDTFLFFKRKRLLIVAAIVFFLINSVPLLNNLKTETSGLQEKNKVVLAIKQRMQNKKFNVVYDGAYSADVGFRYLLLVNSVKESGDFHDPLVQVHYTASKNDVKVGRFGLTFPK